MRPGPRLLAAICSMVAGAAACGQIAGLAAFSRGDESAADSSTPKPEPEAASGDDDQSTADEPSESDDQGHVGDPVPVGMTDASEADEDSVDAEAGGEGDGGDAAAAGDAGDAGRAHDGSAPVDAGIDTGAPSDASTIPDGYVCGPSTCPGCCTASGDCAGGQSVDTCGVGGASCNDCKSTGACSAGVCSTPPKEAGPPAVCDVSTCRCAGAPIQGACCKLDQTCGCQWTIFAPCL